METLFKRFACMASDTHSMALQPGHVPEFAQQGVLASTSAKHHKQAAASAPWTAVWEDTSESRLEKSMSISSASSASARSEASAATIEWPIFCPTPFAHVPSPLQADPHDFAGRTVGYILHSIKEQLDAASTDNNVLLAALIELEKLSFRPSYIQSMAHENAHCIPLMARALRRHDDLKSACKAAVVLWNLGFQVKETVQTIKQYDVVETLGALVAYDDRNCRYAASGCLSVLTAASASCRERCVATGALPHLVACLAYDDANLIYHAGGTMYYIAQHPEYVQGIIDSGAVPAYQRLLHTDNANNVKLARRALGRLGIPTS